MTVYILNCQRYEEFIQPHTLQSEDLLTLASLILKFCNFTCVCWIPCDDVDGADLAQNLSHVCFHGNGVGAACGHVTFPNTLIIRFHCQIPDDCDDVDVWNNHIIHCGHNQSMFRFAEYNYTLLMTNLIFIIVGS